MLSSSEVERLAHDALKLLEELGIQIDDDQVRQCCTQKGCTQDSDGRVQVPRGLIDDMVAFQKRTQEQYERDHELIYSHGPDWTHYLIWIGQVEDMREKNRKRFSMQAFDCGPTTYYDYQAGAIRPVDTGVFDMMMKFAEATPEIGYTSMWYRQDVPPRIERLASLRHSMDLTTKFTGIEAIYPEVVKYLKEASEILTGDPGSSVFLAGSECMIPPLILDERSARDILARKACGVHRYHVASMPTVGVSTPVTTAAAIVMSAAELLGGMAACWCVDPEADLSARMIPNIVDMRNGNATTFGPTYCLLGMGVRQLFQECWGGHCMVEVCFSPTAQRPGLQAVFENAYLTNCRQQWDERPDIPYGGMGTLYNGALGSPTQFMLDMEIRKAQWTYAQGVEVSDETIVFDEVVSVVRNHGNFLTTPHTMMHFRELWGADCFRSDAPTTAWDGSEKAILDTCDEAWRDNLAKWEPPDWPEDKRDAIDQLVDRAKEEFGID